MVVKDAQFISGQLKSPRTIVSDWLANGRI